MFKKKNNLHAISKSKGFNTKLFDEGNQPITCLTYIVYNLKLDKPYVHTVIRFGKKAAKLGFCRGEMYSSDEKVKKDMEELMLNNKGISERDIAKRTGHSLYRTAKFYMIIKRKLARLKLKKRCEV